MAKILFSNLEKMNYEEGDRFLQNNGYGATALTRDPDTERHSCGYDLYDADPNIYDDANIIHSVSFIFYRKPNSNEPDKEELWHWEEKFIDNENNWLI